MLRANITDIKKFAVHDGDGIRTTVFFKGCSLKCVWCHNPETIQTRKQLAFYTHKCTLCGRCADVCPCHRITDGRHILERSRCVSCGKCTKVCPAGALRLWGEETTVDELLPILLEDREFYENSGGGITLSGGECLLQADFCRELLKACKAEGLNTAVDTCGQVPREDLEKVFADTDRFLYDIKTFDPEVHKTCTGHNNRLILDNLHWLDEKDAKIEIRVPFVPGYNDNQMEKIAEMVNRMKNVVKVRVLAYHDYARSKYEALSLPDTLPPILPTKEQISKAQTLFKKR